VQFERRLKGLKQCSTLEQALRKLEGDGRDKLLLNKIKKIRSSTLIMQRLESLWGDETLAEIQEAKRIGTRRLQGLMKIDLEGMGTKVKDWRKQHHRREMLRFYTFLCIRQLRDGNCHQRSDWEKIYKEVETAKRLPHLEYWRFREEEAWIEWMKQNTIFPDDTMWKELDLPHNYRQISDRNVSNPNADDHNRPPPVIRKIDIRYLTHTSD
jgi:hypothetical protein